MTIIKEFTDKYPTYNVIYLTKSGSQLYGTNTPESDTDYMGIFVPPIEDLILRTAVDHWSSTTGKDSSKNTKDDIDIQLWSVQKFLKLLQKGETGAVDLLFSLKRVETQLVYTTHAHTIEKVLPKLLHKQVHSFIGFCISQSRKYGIKGERYEELATLIASMKSNKDSIKTIVEQGSFKHTSLVLAPGPRGTHGKIWYLEALSKKFDLSLKNDYILDKLENILDSYGARAKAATNSVDWKSLSNAARVILEVTEFLLNGKIVFPLADADYILDIKQGKTPIEDISAFITKALNKVDALLVTSKLNTHPNIHEYNKLLLSFYGRS